MFNRCLYDEQTIRVCCDKNLYRIYPSTKQTQYAYKISDPGFRKFCICCQKGITVGELNHIIEHKQIGKESQLYITSADIEFKHGKISNIVYVGKPLNYM